MYGGSGERKPQERQLFPDNNKNLDQYRQLE